MLDDTYLEIINALVGLNKSNNAIKSVKNPGTINNIPEKNNNIPENISFSGFMPCSN